MTPLVRRYIKTSLVFLAFGLGLGAYIVVSQFLLDVYPARLLVTAHAHLLLVGFMVGDPTRAREVLESSIAQAKQLGTTTLLAWGQGLLATALLALGQVSLVPALCEEAIRLAEDTHDRLANALAHRTLAEGLAGLTPPDVERAERAILDAIRIQQEFGSRPELARSYLSHARLLRGWNRIEDAKRHFLEALAMALVRLARLSVQPVTETEWRIVCQMGGLG